jgi:hypothetical protein
LRLGAPSLAAARQSSRLTDAGPELEAIGLAAVGALLAAAPRDADACGVCCVCCAKRAPEQSAINSDERTRRLSPEYILAFIDFPRLSIPAHSRLHLDCSESGDH